MTSEVLPFPYKVEARSAVASSLLHEASNAVWNFFAGCNRTGDCFLLIVTHLLFEFWSKDNWVISCQVRADDEHAPGYILCSRWTTLKPSFELESSSTLSRSHQHHLMALWPLCISFGTRQLALTGVGIKWAAVPENRVHQALKCNRSQSAISDPLAVPTLSASWSMIVGL
jgi:hypothetical protein